LQALDYLHSDDGYPCVVLLDLMMPVMDGWQVMEILRREKRLDELAIVVVSATRGTRPSGAKRYLNKPFDIRVLLDTVQEFCRGVAAGGST